MDGRKRREAGARRFSAVGITVSAGGGGGSEAAGTNGLAENMNQKYQAKMDEKTRFQQKPLISRLQHGPKDTKIPHMEKGKFVKPEQASSTEENENLPAFPGKFASDLRTAVYRADTARKQKIKTEGKMGFEYTFSRIHKDRAKLIVDQHVEMMQWPQRRSLEDFKLKKMSREKLPRISSHEKSGYIISDTSVENEGKYNR